MPEEDTPREREDRFIGAEVFAVWGCEAGTDDLADRLERALADGVKRLALSLDERALMLAALDDPPTELAQLRAVLLADHQWRRNEGLD